MTATAAAAPVLVTGACGRIAGGIIRRLLQKGRTVLATDRTPAPADPSAQWGAEAAGRLEFVQADLCDLPAVERLAARSGDVVHVGALPGPSEQTPPGVDGEWAKKAPIGLESVAGLELLRQNLIGTCGLFEAVARRRDGCRVVFSSSLFAMGWTHNPRDFVPRYLPLDEEHGPMPMEHYGLSKAMAEDYALMLSRAGGGGGSGGAELCPTFVSLRFSNIVKEERWGALPIQTAEVPSFTPLMWAYTHEADVVEAHLQALEAPADSLPSRCEAFLIAAEDTRVHMPTTALLEQHYGGASPPLKRPLPGHTSIVSCTKARRLLGFAPRSFRGPAAPSAAAAAASVAEEGRRASSTFEVPKGFLLRSGASLDGGFLTYQTYGEMNAERSNVVLHPTSFDAVHWELEFNVGPGKMLDTSKYFVIIVNLLGNGVSFSPSSAKDGDRFPLGGGGGGGGGVSICDNVRLQALLLDSLGVDKLALIYGYSMGAMQALHWGVMFPDRVARIAAVCGAARASDYNLVFLESLRAALLADPDCVKDDNGRLRLVGPCARGLEAFARIYAGWGVSREFYEQEVWRSSSRDGVPFCSREDFVARSYVGGFAGGHPLNLIAQLEAWSRADVSAAHGLPPGTSLKAALGRVKARVYMMPCTTDRYFAAPEIQKEAALLPHGRFLPIDSVWGHRAGDTHRPGQERDAAFLAAAVRELLLLPEEA